MFLFLKGFIYLTEKKRERESERECISRGRCRQREKQAPS